MLIVMILLVYAMSQFIRQPGVSLNIQLPWIFIPITINFRNLVWLGIAFLAGAGMNWILDDSFSLNRREKQQHWLLPALTAWVIGALLYALPSGSLWWLIYVLGGILLTVVFLDEFYCADPADPRAPTAAITLTAISFALFFLFTASIRSAGARLYLLAPAVTIAAVLISLRTLYLRSGAWQTSWSVACALVVAQIAVGLFYLPVSPLPFGLILTGILFALVNLGEVAARGALELRDLLEPGITVAVTILLAVLLG